MSSISIAEYHALLQPKKKRAKYGNKRIVIDGYKFDSIKEGVRYQELKILKLAGEIRYFIRQVPFELAPDLTYRADFMICWADGSITFEDVKGYKVQSSMNKIKMVKEKHGVEIILL
jgi:hypothetical protein